MVVCTTLAALEELAGPGDSHATHFALSLGLVTQQTEHVHVSAGALNLSPNPQLVAVCGGFVTTSAGLLSFSALRTSITLPVFNSATGLKLVSFSGVFLNTGFTGSGELKLKLGGFELTAAAASCGLTVTSGAENVNAGREADEIGKHVLLIPFVLVVSGAVEDDSFAVIAGAATETSFTTGGGGSKLKLGRLDKPIGIGTAVSSGPTNSSSSSSRMRTADSRTGADFRVRIFPPACVLIGVLDTGAASATLFVAGVGRLITCAGVPTESLDAGGPKFGRRRFSPKPSF